MNGQGTSNMHYSIPASRYPPAYMEPLPEKENKESCCCFSSMKKCFAIKFDSFLYRTFYKLGSLVAIYTGYFIIVPLFLTAILATGFKDINYIQDPEYLFTPSNAMGSFERAEMEKYFNINFSENFHPSRITRNVPFARLIMVAKDKGDILRQETWNDILEINQIVSNFSIIFEEEEYQFNDLCAIWDNNCWKNDISDLEWVVQNRSSYNLTYPTMINPVTNNVVVFPFTFGDMEIDDNDNIQSVKAIAVTYWLKADTDQDKEKAALWEEELLQIFKYRQFDHIEQARFTSRTLEVELENNTYSVIPYFSVTVTIMYFFSIVTVMMGDWVRSKPYIGFMGITCALLSVTAAFGGLIYIGVPFIGINLAAPFLMLGIGIDDTFVMLAAWRKTNIKDSVAERLGKTYAEAAVSITITSLTNMISFYIGVITPFPSVQIYCIYTGTAVFVTYVWHITLFGGCLALAGYAEKGQRHSIVCLKVKSKSEAEANENCAYQFFCAGGINKTDPDNSKDNKDHALMVFFRDYVARFLNIPPIKALVIMIFLIYLAGGLYGCNNVREGLDKRRLASHDSYSIDFYNLEDKYFREYPYRVQVLLTGDIEYHNPETQKSILELHELFENETIVADSLYTESWMRSFYEYLDKTQIYYKWNITDEVTFIDTLRTQYLYGPIDVNTLDIVFNEDYTKIVASRFIIQTYGLKDTNADKEMMERLREIAKNSKFNVTVYHQFFLFFDQYVLVRQISIQSISLAALVMIIVAVIFIPNPLCSLWVAFSMISIEIGVVGYMTLWGVNLDSISMTNLIMCIGFSVDFSAHICYSYLSAKVDTPDERVKESLFGLGMPILQGGVSTILGVLVLAFAPSYIFITFFKTVFLVIFFGAIHGILLLPVLLSLFGPGSCSKKKTHKKESNVVPTHFEMLEGGMRIPRPYSIANFYHSTPRISQSYLSTGTPINEKKSHKLNMETDQGLGTSVEESSQSSKEISMEGSPNNHGRNNVIFPNSAYDNYAYINEDLDAHDKTPRKKDSDNRKMYPERYYKDYNTSQGPRMYYSSTMLPSNRFPAERPKSNAHNQRRGNRTKSTPK